MPVQQFVADKHLMDQGLTNYWGYNSIGFFAPDARYASTDIPGQQVAEFKTMVKTLHREGIEVILDVVSSMHAPAHYGQSTVLGDGDARGWLPVRPGLDAGARTPRGRSVGGIL
jgi:1,4-alpha-glucan branching enzyme